MKIANKSRSAEKVENNAMPRLVTNWSDQVNN